ncbi:MAG: cell division protein FtsL [Myxococcales bacterium]|nr:cell division protein FtsL [Myxococcales bacterium]
METAYRTDIAHRLQRQRGIRFFVATLLFTALLTAAGIFHVWYNYEVYSLGHKLAKQTVMHRKLLDETKKLKLELSTLKRSQNLNQIAKDKLGLRHAEQQDWVLVK